MGQTKWSAGTPFSNMWQVRFNPYNFTGRFTSLATSSDSSYVNNHNLNTINVFTVVANGRVFTGQSSLRRIYLNQADTWVFPDSEGMVLKEADGTGVALFTPMAIAVATYNFSPGSDNQATLDAIKKGAHVAGDLAIALGSLIGGKEVGEAMAKLEKMYDNAVDFVVNFFHSTKEAQLGLRASGGTTISYQDVVIGSQNPATGRTGTKKFLVGYSYEYGRTWRLVPSRMWWK